MDENEIVEAPQVADTPLADAPVVETPKETFDQTLERVAREAIDGKRDSATGQFQPKVAAPGAPEGTEVPGSPQAAPPDPAKPVIDAPQSLPADVKAKWQALPPEVQEYWAKREGEVHQKFTTDGERLKSLSAFEEVTRPLESRLKQLNAPAPEYFRRLAAADQLLATDGVRGLQQIAQMYGIDLRAALTSNPQGPTPTQPNVEALVEQKLQEKLQEHLWEQRVAEKTGEIDKFKAALPADEQPDFDKLDSLMAGLLQANPKWNLDQLYKAARRADPDTLARDEVKKSAEAQKNAEAEAKKKAAQDARLAPLSRRPGSTPTGPVKGKTWQDTMGRVADEVYARE
jgi:hypothetical protein